MEAEGGSVKEPIRIRVYGFPLAWMRPRAQRAGGFIRFFTHPKMEDWKRTVQAQVIPVKPATLLQGALSVTMRFHLARPQSLPKKVVHHTKKPDVENCAKAILDYLTGLIYRDDAQVCELHLTKAYSDQPGVEIEVVELSESRPVAAAPEQEALTMALVRP